MNKSARVGGSVHSRIARALGERILSGELTPGSVLPPETELSRLLRSSRSALREALKLLVSKGLVEARPRAGTRICRRSNWNFLDPQLLEWQASLRAPNSDFYAQVLELRLLVEPAVAAMAARRRRPFDLQRLTQGIDKLAEAKTPEERRVEIDFFQRSILGASQNDLIGSLHLSACMMQLIDETKCASLLSLCRSLLRSITDQDVEKAETSMRELVLFLSGTPESGS